MAEKIPYYNPTEISSQTRWQKILEALTRGKFVIKKLQALELPFSWEALLPQEPQVQTAAKFIQDDLAYLKMYQPGALYNSEITSKLALKQRLDRAIAENDYRMLARYFLHQAAEDWRRADRQDQLYKQRSPTEIESIAAAREHNQAIATPGDPGMPDEIFETDSSKTRRRSQAMILYAVLLAKQVAV